MTQKILRSTLGDSRPTDQPVKPSEFVPPRLGQAPGVSPLVQEFLKALRQGAFEGDILVDHGSRLLHATDNSVYQIYPQAVLCPRRQSDVVLVARLAAESRFCKLTLSPRGGGTGTNGQALTEGIVVDVSRYMNRILDLDLESGRVTVEPGVVLDQLNAFLRPHGMFFAPTLSPSNRATLGGMISTDACGKGSRIYGRTSNHVEELSLVLTDGALWRSRKLDRQGLDELCGRQDRLGEAARVVDEVTRNKASLIAEQFPKLPRFLTGYNLAHVRGGEHDFNLNPLIAGSEGTLAFVTEATLRILPLPAHKRLVAIRYRSFDDALEAARLLVQASPGAIETIDAKILELARRDAIWHRVGPMLEDTSGEPTAALNLVEFEGPEAAPVEDKLTALCAELDQRRGQVGQASGYVVAADATEAAGLWDLRKKGVGLLGAAPGERRPVAFVEDTVVPPERLADYVREFRSLLDAHGLQYGMFGHVDVGCLHVRPALNLRDAADEALLRTISDRVAALVKRYGGLMWGEHGKGFRSEYNEEFFGPELYAEVRRIKGAFDPHNQLNPGKLAVPAGDPTPLVSVGAKKRGEQDRQISPASQERYAIAVHCNGNGACFDYAASSVMCPSWHVTRDRIHSPKGRAAMMREWLRQASQADFDAAAAIRQPTGGAWAPRRRGEYDFSHEVYEAMHGCLSCKACATGCPIKVDVPELKSEFLELYHRRYPRPLRDHFVARLERMLRLLAWVPRLSNAVMRSRWFRWLMRHVVGIVDTPLLSETSLKRELAARQATFCEPQALLPVQAAAQDKPRVFIAQDVFTTYYDTQVVVDVFDLLRELDFAPEVLPFRPNGKALHVKGFVHQFRQTAAHNAELLQAAAQTGTPIIGIEPAVTLTYRDEYRRALGNQDGFKVELLQDWLLSHRADIDAALRKRGYRAPSASQYRLLGHCTERTAAPTSQRNWQQLFELFGLELQLEAVGCCGMCGVYGHEADHVAESRALYAMSWQQKLAEASDDEHRQRFLATGHSCRTQVERCDDVHLRHPAQALLAALRG